MSKHFKENKKDPSYYVTLFKIEGHTTWRAHMGADEKAFARQVKDWKTNAPKIIAKKVIRIDRLTGHVDKPVDSG